tara:strand:+ start:721 stop:903 length:183 start_codon:yes stop_codon:yes gene_type:complete
MYTEKLAYQKEIQFLEIPKTNIDNYGLQQMLGGKNSENKVMAMSSLSGRCSIRCTIGCNP